MIRPLLRSAGLALFVGLTALGGSAAEAGNFSVNLNARTSTQTLPQTTFVGVRHIGLGGVTTPPPPVYQGPGPRPHAHAFDRNTQFDGMADSSVNGKLPK